MLFEQQMLNFERMNEDLGTMNWEHRIVAAPYFRISSNIPVFLFFLTLFHGKYLPFMAM